MRLIDADEFIEDLDQLYRRAGYGARDVHFSLMDIKWNLRTMPSVDAEPVRHGHWNHLGVLEAYDIAGQKVFAEKRECSMCHFKTNFIEGYGLYNYCPNCGAKMDEEAVT